MGTKKSTLKQWVKRGLGAGRKLKTHRREQRWADKDFNKANLGSEWKKPFAGCSHSNASFWKRLVSKRNSRTRLFVSAFACSSSRTVRRLRASSREMVA